MISVSLRTSRSISSLALSLLLALSLINVLLASTYVSVIVLADSTGSFTRSLSSPSIGTLGIAWDHVALSVTIVREAWVGDEYITAVKQAFKVWDEALEAFANAYGYSYLKKFSFSVTVSTTAGASDIVVSFTTAVAQAGSKIGSTRILYSGSKIISVNITLYIHTASGDLTPLDVFNVAMHEIGHALGLDHASSSTTGEGLPELMYPVYSFPSKKIFPSTLDAYALAKVYEWLASGIFSVPPASLISLPSSIPYRMLLYYRISVFSPYGMVLGGGWYPKGSVAEIRVMNTTVYLDNLTRAVFRGWEGSIRATSPVIQVTVAGDMTIYAVWEVQHYVRIESHYAETSVISGWYREGEYLKIKISETLIVCNNGTRRVFRGWSGSVNSTSPEVTVCVDRPLTIAALWETQYYVSIKTNYSAVNFTEGWIPENSTLIVSLKDVEILLGNNTRLAFKGWNGTILENPLCIIVKRPVTLVAVWSVQHYVKVVDPFNNTNIKEGWYDEGRTLEFKVSSTVVYHGNDSRSVFIGWLVDGEVYSKPAVSIRVEKPLTVECLWTLEYLVKLKLIDMEGGMLSGNIVLRHDSGDTLFLTVAREGLVLWMRKGLWRIVRAEYEVQDFRSGRVLGRLEALPDKSTLNVKAPGSLNIVLKVWKVTLRVADLLGVPVPGVVLRIRSLNASYISSYEGYLATLELPEGEICVELSFLNIFIGVFEMEVKGSEVHTLRVLISPYTVIIGLVLALLIAKRAAIMGLRSRIGSRGSEN